MSKSKIISSALIAAFLAQSFPVASAKIENPDIQKIPLLKNEAGQKYKEGEVIITYKKSRINLEKNSGQFKAKSLENSKQLKEVSAADDLNLKVLKSEKATVDVIAELKNDPNIESIQPNYLKQLSAVPNDPDFSAYQWALQNTGQIIPDSIGDGFSTTGQPDADIDAPEAWDLEKASNQEIVVAVIDTGARISHEDLTSNIWTNTDEIPGNGIDDDGNGYVDDVHGWDFKDGDNDPDDSAFVVDAKDLSGHGTFISGIIGGISNNSLGISGISLQNKIKVMPLRFGLDSDTEVAAINYARNNGAIIINASFGASTVDPAEQAAINAFPGLIVAAAGNSSSDNETTHFYPSDYSDANIISVAATDQNDNLASFSNYGKISVDLGAPGVNIASTINKNSQQFESDISYAIGDGTSFAAPFVAASAAMLFSANSALTSSQVKSKILSSGDSLNSLTAKTTTGKRLNLSSALQAALKADKPSSSLPGGTYTSSQALSLSSSTAGASIHYTLDGSTPSASSQTYSSPLTISSSSTLKAVAIKSGLADSDVFSATYTINIPSASLTPAAPTTEQLKAADYDAYQKYAGYLKYQKYKDYQKYKKAKNKYGFQDTAEKASYKKAYENYRLFLKSPLKFRQYASLYSQYKKYKKYRSSVTPLSKYSRYSKYGKYSAYKNYGSSEYKAAYERYLSY